MATKTKHNDGGQEDIPDEIDFSDGARDGMEFARKYGRKGILLDRELVTEFESVDEIEQVLREYLARKAKRQRSA